MYSYTGTASVLKKISLKQYGHYFFLNHGKHLSVELVTIYQNRDLRKILASPEFPSAFSSFFSFFFPFLA